MSAVLELSPGVEPGFPDEWYEITADGHFWLEWRFRAFIRQLDALKIPRTLPWHGLDIGCGHGVVRRQVEHATAWVTDGADLNREGLAQNRTRSGQTMRYDVRDRHPELRQHYDFVILFDVLEHIDDTQPFLEAVVYHLKPGGWLFLNVPALDSLRSSFDQAVGHRRRYNRQTLRAEFDSHQLQIRDMRYWGFSMLPYLVLRKLLSPRDAPVAHVIQRGVLPPWTWMNRWILRIMNIETLRLKRPPLGTSLLTAAVKVGDARAVGVERVPS